MSANAIVIGGGIGGLLAAHALASRGARVTLLERSRYVDPTPGLPPAARRGVPQSHCLHMLMGAGTEAFDALVPGWRRRAIAGGATPFDACADAAIRFPGGWLARERSGVTMHACSRALIETVLREELGERPGVRVLQETSALGLALDPSDARVVGVRVADHVVPADLVVDAAGAASRLSRWLGASVEETEVASPWLYVSRWYRLAPDDAPDWHCLSVAPGGSAPDRAAMMLRAENGFWNVVLLCGPGRRPPCDDAAFTAFASDLGEGRLGATLAMAEPASAIHAYGRTASRKRRWEKLDRWPAGLAALGDSVMTLDPYFGLGMTAAARGAALLADFAETQADGAFDGRAFQRALARLNERPWRLATGRGLEAALYDAAPSRPDIAHAILRHQHLLGSSEAVEEEVAR